jgi:hypothetical protein
MCITSSSLKHNGHLPLSAFLLIPFSCRTPASSHGIPFLSLLDHHSTYNFLPQEKFISRYRINELFSDSFAKIFCVSILDLSFTIFLNSVKLHPFCFVHTNANPVWYRNKMPTDQNKKKEIVPLGDYCSITNRWTKIPRYFEGFWHFSFHF